MALDIDAQGLALAALAKADRAARRLQPVASGAHFPFQPSTVTTAAGNQMAFRTMHWFPKGATGVRLLFSSVYAGAQETPTATGFPLKLAAALEPAPWDAARTYQPGEQVVGLATMYNAAGSFNPVPYYTAVNASTNSRPTPSNPDWSVGTAFPTRVPVTVGGVQDASFAVQTLPGGASAAKGLVLTDPIPLRWPDNSWIGIYYFLPCSGAQVAVVEGQSQNLALGPLNLAGASVPDVTSVNIGVAGMLAGSIGSVRLRPAAILGQPLTPARAVAIVGDSIAEGKIGGNACGFTLTAGGTGYKVGDILTPSMTGATAGAIAAGSNPRTIVDRVDGSGTILNVRAIDGGAFTNTSSQTGQTLPSGTQTFAGGAGSGATCTLVYNANSFDVGDALGGQGYIERALNAAGVAYAAFSASGDRANLWTGARAMTRIAAIAQTGARNAFLMLGRNDLTSGDSAATIQANLLALANALLGAGVERVFVGTVTPETTSTTAAGQSTLAGQTVSSNNAARQTLNAWIRTCPAPFSGVIDVAATIEDGGAGVPSGKFAPIGGQASAADGKHPGPLAVTLMQAAVAAIVGRLAV